MIFQRPPGRSVRVTYGGRSSGRTTLSAANDQDGQEDGDGRRNWAVVLVLSVPVFATGCMLLALL